ncbi:MAG: hypothetical protein IPM25_16405 [Chloracidobacterium sp.]|nr:hypothetical protein [Chloracidobacterium sp.]
MKTKASALILLATFLFAEMTPALACGPFIMDVVFSLKRHPELPLDRYLNGETGIVPNSFRPMSLILFYRELNGLSLTAAEKVQAKNAMQNKIFYLAGPEDPKKLVDLDTPQQPAEDIWRQARAKVTGEKVEFDKDRRSGYVSYINCLPDSFRNAAKTLESRISAHGLGDHTKEWLKGQDAVFANCGGDSPLPAEFNDGPAWLRHDRAYQIAAALLYREKNAEARAAFEKIAADASSPWKNTARFVAARTYIRESSLIGEDREPDSDPAADENRRRLLQKAVDSFAAIIADPSMSEFHASAARMTGLAKFRATPQERRLELSRSLSSGSDNPNFYNDFVDLAMLLDRARGMAEEVGWKREQKEAEVAGREYNYNYVQKLQDVPAEFRTDPLSDWLLTYHSTDGFDHSYNKWKETSSLHWFVAAIAKAEASAPATAELLAEADKIAADSRAYHTVRFHQIRLLLDSGKIGPAKTKFDELGDIARLPLSTQNSFLAQRAVFSSDLNEYLRYAQRKPAMFTWDSYESEEPAEPEGDLAPWKSRVMFDADGALFLNEKVPLSVLKQAAVSPSLPAHLKRMVAIAAWTRAFVLKNAAVEREMAPVVRGLIKQDMPEFSRYFAASGTANREAAALTAILRNPVVQPYVETGYGREDSEPTVIDSIRGNWWCVEDHAAKSGINFPSFLSAEQTAAAEREKAQLKALGESATMLTRRALDFAAANPRHRQTPEILHLAVRSTRYGCTDDDTGANSKRAFDLLHRRYANSVWTRRTPYWFK